MCRCIRKVVYAISVSLVVQARSQGEVGVVRHPPPSPARAKRSISLPTVHALTSGIILMQVLYCLEFVLCI